MLHLFSRYFGIGVVNTLIHWGTFACIYYFFGVQSISNLVGFCVAVTFSFFANAKFTFKVQPTAGRYLAFVLFLGAISFGIGRLADTSQLPPWLTLVVFSGLSLVLGFIYSRFFVFRTR